MGTKLWFPGQWAFKNSLRLEGVRRGQNRLSVRAQQMICWGLKTLERPYTCLQRSAKTASLVHCTLTRPGQLCELQRATWLRQTYPGFQESTYLQCSPSENRRSTEKKLTKSSLGIFGTCTTADYYCCPKWRSW